MKNCDECIRRCDGDCEEIDEEFPEVEDDLVCDLCGKGWDQHDDGECPRNISECDIRMEIEAATILGIRRTTENLTHQQNDLIWEPKE